MIPIHGTSLPYDVFVPLQAGKHQISKSARKVVLGGQEMGTQKVLKKCFRAIAKWVLKKLSKSGRGMTPRKERGGLWPPLPKGGRRPAAAAHLWDLSFLGAIPRPLFDNFLRTHFAMARKHFLEHFLSTHFRSPQDYFSSTFGFQACRGTKTS